jgi:hypothetical protein
MRSIIDEFDKFLSNPVEYIISYVRDISRLIVTLFFFVDYLCFIRYIYSPSTKGH